MPTIDRLRSANQTPELPVDVAPLQGIAVNAQGAQARNSADALVQQLATFSRGLGDLRDFTVKREKEQQVRQAALLAEMNKDLPKGYYREGVQAYDTTRGAIQGRSIATQLALSNQSFIQEAEKDGGTIQEKQARYTQLLDNYSSLKNTESQSSSAEYKMAMNQQLNTTRTQLEVAYIKKLKGDFQAEQTTTQRSLIDLTVEDRIANQTMNVQTGVKSPLITLKDYKEFIKQGSKTTEFTKEQLRSIWLNRMIEIANTGVDDTGEPVPEVLEHVFESDSKGFKLIFDSELGKAAQEGHVSAQKAFITYHTNRITTANRTATALSEKTRDTFMSSMIKSFINGEFIDQRADIAQALDQGALRSKDANALLTLNDDYLGTGWTGNDNDFNRLMRQIETYDPHITETVLFDEYAVASQNKSGINPEQFAKLIDAYKATRSAAATPYRNAVSDMENELNRLLKADTAFSLSSSTNKLRRFKAMEELRTHIADTTRILRDELKLNVASDTFASEFRRFMTPVVQQLGTDERFVPTGLSDLIGSDKINEIKKNAAKRR